MTRANFRSDSRPTGYYLAIPPRQSRRADAAKWLRSTFTGSKDRSDENLRLLAKEISATFSEREDRVGYFLAIMRDDANRRPIRMAAVAALSDQECFDYKHPASKTASDVFRRCFPF